MVSSAHALAVAISAALGGAVGLLRQWTDAANRRHHVDLGGARTYALWSALGCAGDLLSGRMGPLVVVAVVGAIALHEIVALARVEPQRTGSTSFASALLAIIIGVLIGAGERKAAVVVASITAITLVVKRPVHAWARRLTEDDIRAALAFVAASGVVLPLVPDRAYGPFGAINPHSVWMMVVLISAIGFAGYVAIRSLGSPAGILLTSLFGGIASSTATTLAFSRRSGRQSGHDVSSALGIVVACAVMLVRVEAIVAVMSRTLAAALLLPFALMIVPALIVGGLLWFKSRGDQPGVETPALRNPLSLGTALKFGAAYAAITFLVAVVRHEWQAGLLPLSFVSGLTNMDAITLSLARGAPGDVPSTARALVLAAIANTLLKGGIAVSAGTPLVRRWTAFALGLTALAGIAAVFLPSRAI